jgi:isoquinoline 1-oxidoreductase subunit beta
VLGKGTWQALSGRRALDVEWDEGPGAANDSASLWARFAESATRPGVAARTTGDARAALAGAAQRLEVVYELPFLHHATMEPMNCTAHVRADGCDVWAPTQAQTNAQEVAAELTGLPKEKVRIHTTLLGGGFGRRAEQDFVSEAVLLSKKTGRPVQVVWTREDDVRHSFYRPATHNRLAAGLDASGKLVAWTHHIVGPAILKFKFGELDKGVDRTLVEGAANVPYAIPNVLVEQTVMDTAVPIGFWRSVGSSHNAFVTECFFDEIARAAKRDPYEFRRELLKEQPRHLAALDLAADKAGWGKALPEGRFRGIAVAESFGSFVAQVAEISLGSDGSPRVHRVVVAVDCGPYVNPDTIVAQMESGVVYGLSAALYGEITLEKGRVQQSNFHDYPVLRMAEMPRVETHIIESAGKMGGIGEPGTPPIAPAVANAIHSGTGRPVRRLPIVSKIPAKTAKG